MLEGKLAELIEFGEENDAIGEKMHRLCLALIPAGDLQGMLQALYYNLREDFAVPHAVVRVWHTGPGMLTGPEFVPVSDDLRLYATGLEHPIAAPVQTPRSRRGSARRRRSCARSPACRCATPETPASACSRSRARIRRASTRRWARSTSSAWASSRARRCNGTGSHGGGSGGRARSPPGVARVLPRAPVAPAPPRRGTRHNYHQDINACSRSTRASRSNACSRSTSAAAWRSCTRAACPGAPSRICCLPGAACLPGLRGTAATARIPARPARAERAQTVAQGALARGRRATPGCAGRNAPDIRDKAMFELAYSSGLRLAELVSLDLATPTRCGAMPK